MKKCRRCDSDNLRRVDDYQYEDLEIDLITPINAIICHDCGCVHWKVEGHEFWEYSIITKEDNLAEVAGGYATGFNVKAGLN